MNRIVVIIFFLILSKFMPSRLIAQDKIHPANIEFKRQGVQRLIFDPAQSILLSRLNPSAL